MMPVKQAMILAAGRGARFRPVTDTTPKPLVEVCGKKLIDWQLEMLEMNGIERVVVNVCYLKEQVIEHVQGWRSRFDIIISEEDAALETGGGIKNALHHFNGELFYAINSDVILHPQHGAMLHQLARAFELREHTEIALLLHYTSHAVGIAGAGDFFCDQQGDLQRRGTQKSAPFYFTGVQLVHPRAFDGVEASIFSMNVIFDKLMMRESIGIAGVINQSGSMLHVGDPEGHAQVERFVTTLEKQREHIADAAL